MTRIGARIAGATLLAALSSAACEGAPDAEPAAGWVGSITTEGEVTRVITESGSVWPSTPRLVEELSIGVGEGADEYMFGQISSLWAADDRILVVDTSPAAVRMYDGNGEYLFDVGGEGQGPGEYEQPAAGAILPSGQIVVVEALPRIHFYTADGAPLRTHNLGSGMIIWADQMLVVAGSGAVYRATVDFEVRDVNGGPRLGRQEFTPDGPAPEALFPPEVEFAPWCLEYRFRGETQSSCQIPFAPSVVSHFAPDGDWIIGTTDAYRFEIHAPDGSRRVVERYWEPVPVGPAERDWHRRERIGYIEQRQKPWNWTGPEIPEHKPAFRRLGADRSGRVWVLREGASRRVEGECTDDFSDWSAAREDWRPCWTADSWLELFDSEGRFLGELPTSTGNAYQGPFLRGDTLYVVARGDDGHPRVKRYRLQFDDPDPDVN